MLVIRMQRTGRKGHAMFRVVVQDSRRTPSSGKVVAALGSYDPHSKAVVLDKEKAKFYLEHGAQPSPRVAGLLKKEGVKLPGWVTQPANKERVVKNAEKRRSTAPAKSAELAEPVAPAEAPAEPAEPVEAAEEPVPAEAPVEPEVPETEALTEPAAESSEVTAVPEAEAATAEPDSETPEKA
jgi:small subunit ribosomal protein S16